MSAESPGRPVEPRRETAALVPQAFAVGFVIMAFEMIGSRYLTPYFGSSLFTWGSIISAVLLALTGGYFVGGWLADRFPFAALLSGVLALAAFLFLPIPWAAARLAPFIADHLADARYGSLVAALTLIAPPLLLLGRYAPFSIRLALPDKDRAGRISGLIYGVSTMGSVGGTLGAAFFLIPTMRLAAIMLLLAGATYFSSLAFYLAVGRGVGGRRWVLAAGATVVFALASWASWRAGAKDVDVDADPPACGQNPLPQFAHDGKVLEEAHTAYTDITIRQKGDYRSMLFSKRGELIQQSCRNIADERELPLSYAHVMTIAVAYPERLRSMLMIGLGGGSIPNYLHRHIGGLDIQAVELDPGVIRLAKKYFGVTEDARFRVAEDDGRLFLKRHPERYDLIAVDAFRPGFVPFHLLTREFFELAKSRLNDGGALAMNMQFDTPLFNAAAATIERVFGGADYYSEAGLVIIVAGPRGDLAALQARARERQAAWNFRYELPRIFDTNKIAAPIDEKTTILTDDFSPAEYLNAIKRHNEARFHPSS